MKRSVLTAPKKKGRKEVSKVSTNGQVPKKRIFWAAVEAIAAKIPGGKLSLAGGGLITAVMAVFLLSSSLSAVGVLTQLALSGAFWSVVGFLAIVGALLFTDKVADFVCAKFPALGKQKTLTHILVWVLAYLFAYIWTDEIQIPRVLYLGLLIGLPVVGFALRKYLPKGGRALAWRINTRGLLAMVILWVILPLFTLDRHVTKLQEVNFSESKSAQNLYTIRTEDRVYRLCTLFRHGIYNPENQNNEIVKLAKNDPERKENLVIWSVGLRWARFDLNKKILDFYPEKGGPYISQEVITSFGYPLIVMAGVLIVAFSAFRPKGDGGTSGVTAQSPAPAPATA